MNGWCSSLDRAGWNTRHEASSEGVSNAILNTGFHPIIWFISRIQIGRYIWFDVKKKKKILYDLQGDGFYKMEGMCSGWHCLLQLADQPHVLMSCGTLLQPFPHSHQPSNRTGHVYPCTASSLSFSFVITVWMEYIRVFLALFINFTH